MPLIWRGSRNGGGSVLTFDSESGADNGELPVDRGPDVDGFPERTGRVEKPAGANSAASRGMEQESRRGGT